MRNAGKKQKRKRTNKRTCCQTWNNHGPQQKDDYKYLGSLEGDEKRSQEKQSQKNKKNEWDKTLELNVKYYGIFLSWERDKPER